MKKTHVILILTVLVCGGALAYSFAKPDFQAWLRQADAPVVAALNRGAAALSEGHAGQAAEEYAKAEQLALAADAAADEKWGHHGAASPEWHRRADAVKPRDRFLAGKDNGAYRGGLNYFKNRVSEAAYGQAFARLQEIRGKYRPGAPGAFAPPDSVVAPVLETIARGLAASPKSESLRLLKAETLLAAGRPKAAQKELEEVLLMDSQSAEACNLLGIIYSSPVYNLDRAMWEQNHKRALEMFRRAADGTTIDGGKLPDPLLNLGAYYAVPGPDRPENARPKPEDAALAKRYLEEYLRLVKDPEHPGAQQARKLLEKLH